MVLSLRHWIACARRKIMEYSLKQTPRPAAATDGQPDELAGTTQLSKSQLELLVADESLRGMLRDSRLQEQIRAVDTAADREKALQRHFQIPEFKTFADKVLGCIVAV
ncbi:hypothetical protein WJX82_007109 [Trebouxia sp. C0006]